MVAVSLVLSSAAQAGTDTAQRCTLLIVGDSLSSGYGLAPGKSWVELLATRIASRGWTLVNASVAGDTTQNGVDRIDAALARHAPAGVVIELGGNDALRGVPPATLRANLDTLVKRPQARGAWVALLEAPVLPNYGRAYTQAVGRIYAELARRRKLPHVACFVCKVATRPGMMQADGLHPNEQAQPAILEAVWPRLDPLVKSCR